MMTPKEQTERQAVLTEAHGDFQRGLHSHALFKMNDRMVSEDLVQDTFTKTWSYLARGGKIDLMKAFLYHVLNNLIVDEYRKHKPTSLDVLVEKGLEPGVDPTEQLLDRLDGTAALLLIQRLPLAYQNVMRMRYIQNLSLGEMVAVTGQTKNALSVQAHRGLEKLKALYYNTD